MSGHVHAGVVGADGYVDGYVDGNEYYGCEDGHGEWE